MIGSSCLPGLQRTRGPTERRRSCLQIQSNPSRRQRYEGMMQPIQSIPGQGLVHLKTCWPKAQSGAARVSGMCAIARLAAERRRVH